jgi:hypothetical protein
VERFRWKDSVIWDDDLASPSITPNSYASVCKWWAAVMGGIPEFWTHIIVHIDHPRHLDQLTLALESSRPENIKTVTILHSKQSGEIDEEVERVELERMLPQLLQPENKARIRSLAVRTRWSGSLPKTMIHPWPGLRTLRLESERRSLDHLPSQIAPPIPSPFSLSFPLSALGLTGPMFVSLWRCADGRKAMQHASLLSLTVCQLREEDGGREPFMFCELTKAVYTFCGVRAVNLIDIDIPVGRNALGLTSLFTIDGERVNALRFEAVPLRLITHFIDSLWRPGRYSDIGSFKIHHCRELSASQRTAIQTDTAGNIKTLYAELIGVSHPSDLIILLKRLSPNEIRIQQCAGLTDEVLSAIAAGQSTFLKRRQRLHIVDCHNYSPVRLQTLFASKPRVSLNIEGDVTTLSWRRQRPDWGFDD